MTKCLVTGGAGFIGSNLVDELIKQGHEVIVFDNESAECNEKFYWNSKAQNYKYDICDYEKTRPLYGGVDYVFHLAAESRLQPAILNPIEAVTKNAVGTCTVLQCAREAGVKKVIYSSTSSGYGMNSYPNDETQPDDCLNPYSASRLPTPKRCCRRYTPISGYAPISGIPRCPVYPDIGEYPDIMVYPDHGVSPISGYTPISECAPTSG